MPATTTRASAKRSSARRSSAQRPKAQPSAELRRTVGQPATARAVVAPDEATGVAVPRVSAWVGAASAALALIWTAWSVPTLMLWMSRLPRWAGIEAYAASLQPGPFLAWVIPSILLPPTLVALLAVIDLHAPTGRRVWGRLGLLFGLLSAAMLTTNYWMQNAVVMPALMAREFTGLSWLVIGNPLSVAGAIESIGRGAMGLAALFAGLATGAAGRRDSYAQAVRWLLIGNGASGLAGFAVGAVGDTALTLVAMGVWGVTLAVALALLTIRFARLARTGAVA